METIVIVHGTGAQSSSWWQPGSEFCETTDAELEKGGSNACCWAHISSDFPIFQWSGSLSEHSRLEAADNLRDYILRMEMNDGITKYHLIGHSHGGNIMLDALRYLAREPGSDARPLKLGCVITMGTPFLRRSSHLDNANIISSLPIIYWIFYLALTVSIIFTFPTKLVNISIILLIFLVGPIMYYLMYRAEKSMDKRYCHKKILYFSSKYDEALIALKTLLEIRNSPSNWIHINRISIMSTLKFMRSRTLRKWFNPFNIPKTVFMYQKHNNSSASVESLTERWGEQSSGIAYALPFLLFIFVMDILSYLILRYIINPMKYVALITAAKVYASQGLGEDQQLGDSIIEVDEKPPNTLCERIDIPGNIDEEMMRKATISGARVFEEVYVGVSKPSTLGYDKTSILLNKKVIPEAKLVHGQYYQNRWFIKKVSQLICSY